MNLLELKKQCEGYRDQLSVLEGKKQELGNQKVKLKEELKKEGLDKFVDLENKLKTLKHEFDVQKIELETQIREIE